MTQNLGELRRGELRALVMSWISEFVDRIEARIAENDTQALLDYRDWATHAVRNHPTGALKMGLRHGLFCLGCCWALMLLLFVGGVMNLFWVLILTMAVIAEKIFPWGLLMSKALGGVLLAAAAYLAISAYFSPTGSAMGSHAMGCMAGA